MPATYIMAIDQGTTSSRVLLVDTAGRPAFSCARAVEQHFPRPGWVEHDAVEIWRDVQALMEEAMSWAGGAQAIVAIGITNQRETTVVWERSSGEPVHRAIVWQDRRTADKCAALRSEGAEQWVQDQTGLLLDPYFSASKVAWILDHAEGLRGRAEKGELCFGTIDSWLLWCLTGGSRHGSDASNASRTSLFDIHAGAWSAELLKLFKVPHAMLPEVMPTQGPFGATAPGLFERAIPILGIAGDQQAATFGQTCFDPGMVKATFGTGCFLLTNVGEHAPQSTQRLLGTVAWAREGTTIFALEGSIFMAGATMQWLRDGLGLIAEAGESETLAASIDDTGGVHLVPAFAGLGAPHWDAEARGAIVGLSRGSGRAEIVRAGLEAVAFQTRDLIEAMTTDMASLELAAPSRMRVDGGMTANAWLMQFLADQLGFPVERARYPETTALGAAFLAGLEAGFFDGLEALSSLWRADAVFEPHASEAERSLKYGAWREAVERIKSRP